MLFLICILISSSLCQIRSNFSKEVKVGNACNMCKRRRLAEPTQLRFFPIRTLNNTICLLLHLPFRAKTTFSVSQRPGPEFSLIQKVIKTAKLTYISHKTILKKLLAIQASVTCDH